jgi:hypothetical protein
MLVARCTSPMLTSHRGDSGKNMVQAVCSRQRKHGSIDTAYMHETPLSLARETLPI